MSENILKTHKEYYEEVDEDERAQIATIFKHFDQTNRKRISIETLPDFLRLLGKNVGNAESEDLMVKIDKKARGFYTYQELIDLLSYHKFQEDSELGLHQALYELDHDGDGFIKKSELSEFLTSMAEPFN